MVPVGGHCDVPESADASLRFDEADGTAGGVAAEHGDRTAASLVTRNDIDVLAVGRDDLTQSALKPINPIDALLLLLD